MEPPTTHHEDTAMAAAPRHAAPRGQHWIIALIALPAAVSIWSGWVGLGGLCGFGMVHPLPGILSSFRLNTAITLPVGVEAYGSYALWAWLASGAQGPARVFAKRSAIGSLCLGALGQVAYHLLTASHSVRAPDIVIVLVACMPVVTLGFAAALTHLLRAAPVAAEDAAGVPADGMPDVPSASQPRATEDTTPRASDVPPRIPADVPAQAPAGEPAAAVASQPASQRAARPSADPEADKRARKIYRDSVKSGAPLSERALAERFPGKGRTWARNRIDDVKNEPRLAQAQ